jgi:hypothetical protein
MDKKTYYSETLKESYEIAKDLKQEIKRIYPETEIDTDVLALSIFDKIARPWVYAKTMFIKE